MFILAPEDGAVSGSSSTGAGGNHNNNGVGSEAGSNSSALLSDCDPARLAALSYPRLGSAAAGGLGSMYSAASYPSTEQNPYPSIAMENSFYGTLVSHVSATFFRLRSSLGIDLKSYKCIFESWQLLPRPD